MELAELEKLNNLKETNEFTKYILEHVSRIEDHISEMAHLKETIQSNKIEEKIINVSDIMYKIGCIHDDYLRMLISDVQFPPSVIQIIDNYLENELNKILINADKPIQLKSTFGIKNDRVSKLRNLCVESIKKLGLNGVCTSVNVNEFNYETVSEIMNELQNLKYSCTYDIDKNILLINL